MIGFIGGTGPEGRGLATRFAIAGEKVLIGSRDKSRADEAAGSVSNDTPPGSVIGMHNTDVAREAEIVFVAVPFQGHRDTLHELKGHLGGKIVVDLVAPLAFTKGKASAIMVEEGSAALQAQSILTDSKVVAAFQTVSARNLLAPEKSVESDVVVCADDASAKEIVMDLAEKIKGVRAVDGGGLENARYVEDITALLLNINRIYKAHSAIKIVGI